DALGLSHGRGHDRRPEELDGRERLQDHRGFSRIEFGARDGLEESEPELQDRRADQPRQVHRLRVVLHRVLGWRASVYPYRWSRDPGECDSGEPRANRGDADSKTRRRERYGAAQDTARTNSTRRR